ncbi:putative LMBR1-like membrane protein [Trypanosoma vivax]|uniref:Putative LMBR1-like membrane protein n=1 Tax=Trypanosoma vivax (strain Y486) TaxID=1055687 RepID=G0TWL5_TRYVY|nr:putative LMBR1-like membrane protein [Trypanosoma vivax]CCC48353.1 putative LMBR1-like membrane protein [Trypanosoma vivax Y486]
MVSGTLVATTVFAILVLVATLSLFWHYTKVSVKSVPLLCSVCTIVSVYVSILPFPLLVVDISAASEAKGDPEKEARWLTCLWYIIMAITYIMGWVLLPVSQCYTELGQFTSRRKLVYAIKTNIKLYAIMFIVAIVFFAYLAFLKGVGDSFSGIVKLGTGLANAWGLLLLVLFMSAGLVGVPRVLWRRSCAARMLRYAYFAAVDIQEDLESALTDLAAVKEELMSIRPLVAVEHNAHWVHMIKLIDDARIEASQYSSISRCHSKKSGVVHSDVSLGHLEELHERVLRRIKITRRMSFMWRSTLKNCQFYESVLYGVDESVNGFTRFWIYVREGVYKMASVCAAVLTAMLLLSELAVPLKSFATFQLSIVAIVVGNGFELVGSMVFLFYMAQCSYWAIVQLKVFDIYVIMPSISDNASLCFYAIFLTRLIMPLCFNFLLMADVDVEVQYGNVYERNMDVTFIFGKAFNQFLPTFISIVSLLYYVKVVDRLLALFGIEVQSADDVMNSEVRQRIESGHRLVTLALGKPLKGLNFSHLGFEHEEVEGLFQDYSPQEVQPTSPVERGRRYREYLEKKRAAQADHDV